MAIIVNDQPTGPRKEYPVPSEGMSLVVLADVEELGIQQNEYYGPRREVNLYWVVNEKDPDGNFFVIRRNYTASMHEKSNLFADVKDMIGKIPPSEIDLETLIGHFNLGVIKQVSGTGKNQGRTFANIKTFLTAKPGDKFTVPADYVRAKDGGKFGRKQEQRNNVRGTGANAANTGRTNPLPPQQEIADSDIPF